MDLNGNSSSSLPLLTQDERREAILAILHKNKYVRVDALSGQLGVSKVTIRRDLELLELERLVERTHGGATLSRRMRIEPEFQAEYQHNFKEKRDIGRAAAALVDPGETIFVSSGTTTLHLIHELAGKNVTVVTSNAEATSETRNSNVNLILTGGQYRDQSRSFIGPITTSTIERFVASKTFIGVYGLSLEYGLTTFTVERAEIVRKMVECTSGKLIVLADHTKMGQVADCQIAPLERCDALVVDAGIDEEFRRELEGRGIEVIVV